MTPRQWAYDIKERMRKHTLNYQKLFFSFFLWFSFFESIRDVNLLFLKVESGGDSPFCSKESDGFWTLLFSFLSGESH